jgi:type IV secretion system protein VirD4
MGKSGDPGLWAYKALIWVGAFVLGAVVIVYLAAHVVSILSGNGFAGVGAEEIVKLVPAGGDPVAAWGTKSGVVSRPGLWIAVAVLTVLAIWGARRGYVANRKRTDTSNFLKHKGFAKSYRAIDAAGEKGLQARASSLRPRTPGAGVKDVGVVAGRIGGQKKVFVSVEDSVVLEGPPRSGKGVHVVIPWVLDAPGAVVVTANRPETIAVTMRHRERKNPQAPICLFDPDGATGLPPGKRWSLLRGCGNPQVAEHRAAGMTSGVRHERDHSIWTPEAQTMLAALLQAAVLGGGDLMDIYRWGTKPETATEAIGILQLHPDAAPGWAETLGGVVTGDAKYRDHLWATIRPAVKPLGRERVREFLNPKPEEQIDFVQFFRQAGTFYLYGTVDNGEGTTSSLIAAIIGDITRIGRNLAQALPGGRLDPPCSFVLDEIVQLSRLPLLPELMADGGGYGMSTTVVCQSVAQLASKWGEAEKDAILGAANWRMVLGGVGDSGVLEGLVSLGGKSERNRLDTTYGNKSFLSADSMRNSVQVESNFDVQTMREIPWGCSVVMLKNAGMFALEQQPWWDRPDAKTLKADRALLYDCIRENRAANPFLESMDPEEWEPIDVRDGDRGRAMLNRFSDRVRRP